MSSIQDLKDTCQHACHERHACTHGYKELLDANSASAIASVWRKYWRELVSDQYADVICKDLPYHYKELKDGFNKAGVYFNECPKSYMQQSFVLVGNTDEPVHVYGHATVYVLGKAVVIAHDHAEVHCSQPDGRIELLDYSEGFVSKGFATARERSTLHSDVDCECYEASHVFITHGTVTDHGHSEIHAYNDSVVSSFTAISINLHEKAVLKIR